MMNDQQFRDLVRDMRAAQNSYFVAKRAGQPIAASYLTAAKELEKKVDAELKKVKAPDNTQTTMF